MLGSPSKVLALRVSGFAEPCVLHTVQGKQCLCKQWQGKQWQGKQCLGQQWQVAGMRGMAPEVINDNAQRPTLC